MLTSDVQEFVLYGLEGWPMPPALDKRVETPTHRSRRTHQRTGAGEQKCPIPAAHMAFIAAARIAFVGTIACLVAFRTAFMAFIAAARIAFAMTRRKVSKTPRKRLKASKMRS